MSIGTFLLFAETGIRRKVLMRISVATFLLISENIIRKKELSADRLGAHITLKMSAPFSFSKWRN